MGLHRDGQMVAVQIGLKCGTDITSDRLVSSRDVSERKSCGLPIVVLFVPLFVERPLVTHEARRPAPLMPTAGTQAARVERVPHRAAAIEKSLGLGTRAAIPLASPPRRPFTERTADAARVLIELDVEPRVRDDIAPRLPVVQRVVHVPIIADRQRIVAEATRKVVSSRQ